MALGLIALGSVHCGSAASSGTDGAAGSVAKAASFSPKASAAGPAIESVGESAQTKTALQRLAVTRRQQPPFGPAMAPLALRSDEADWERDYYAAHSSEYARFVALFGDIHALEK